MRQYKLTVLLIFITNFITAQNSIDELKKQGWRIDNNFIENSTAVEYDASAIMLFRVGDYIVNNPEKSIASPKNKNVKTSRIFFNSDGSINYESDTTDHYNENGLLFRSDWVSDSIVFSSNWTYDMKNRPLEYYIMDESSKRKTVYERYVYHNNYIVINNLDNTIVEVITIEKKDNGLLVTLYKDKEKKKDFDIKLKANLISDMVRIIYLPNFKSFAVLKYDYDADNELIGYTRKSKTRDDFINNVQFDYKDSILVRSYDSANHIESLFSDFEKENWTKAVITQNGEKTSVINREFY